MKKLFFTLFVFTSFALGAEAQEMNAQEVNDLAAETAADTEVAGDSIAVDTIVADPDPEWYVAPISYDSVVARFKAPRRAAAANCPIDSVRTFNVDSVLESVTVYEYGDTTRTMIWTVKPDGSRYGSSRTEEGTNGNITFSATYDWDAVAGDWKGTSKEEHTFTGSKETLRTLYDWQNGAWSAKTQYTWVFDAAGRETEYTTYQRNNAGALAYSKQRIREYNTAGKTMLDIQYTAHNGTDWSAGTKRIYDYDGNNTILNEYYSAYTNGAWVGSSKEIWVYTAGKKTYYEKDTWSNGAWIGNTKETWEFNAAGNQTYYEKDIWSNGVWVGNAKELWVFNGPSNKQTLHEKYSWANGDWAISLQENTSYDSAGNNILVENYTYANSVQTGKKKEEYTYNATNKRIETVKYVWINNNWRYNSKAVTNYDAAGNNVETANYSWQNEDWVGVGTRTLQTFDGSKNVTEKITQEWSSTISNWENKTRKTTEYSGAKTTQEATYNWSSEINDWVGVSRSDWHYNSAGLNDTIKTYTPVGTEWIFSKRTVNTYNASGTNIMTHRAIWDGTKWALDAMARLDIIKDAAGRQTLYATWHCGSDSVWIGDQKDTTAYSQTGKVLYSALFTSWANGDWVPSYKIEYDYDEADRKTLEQRSDWSGNSWIGSYKYEDEYDAAGNETMHSHYIGTNSGWMGLSRNDNVYDENGNRITAITFDWNKNWVYSARENCVYDSKKRLIEAVQQKWQNGDWVNYQKRTYGFDSKGQTISTHQYIWLNNQWVYSLRNETYYDEDAQAKLRRQVNGSWNNGVLQSFSDKLYSYTCDILSFTVKFTNYDGTVLASTSVNQGQKPEFKGTEPSKPATEQYSYSFKGWSPEIVVATKNATYVAEYDSVINQYTVAFHNYDGTELQSNTLIYGATPEYNGQKPYKPATAQYTYTFTNWDKALATVTADAVYTAQFDSIENVYTITWLNDDDSQIDQTTVKYGVVPTHDDPTKAGTGEYSYTFTGWDKEVVAVTGDATYKATFSSDKNKYTITWLNDDNSQIDQTQVEYGIVPTHDDPTKQSTAEYTYAFTGWDKTVVAVTGDATYKATFSSEKNKYTITWLNDDNSQIDQTTVEYGVIPTHDDPTKQGTAEYTYTFTGWDKTVVAVTGDATYKATFSSTKNQYTITWLNDDDSQIDQTQVEYGIVPTHDDPTKAATAEFTYTFSGWDKEVVAVTGEATYKATFSASKNKYLITWLYDDGTEIDHEMIEYGTTPQPANPTKESTAQYTFTFTGWDKEITAVTGEATYTAVFDSVVNKYTIIFYYEDGITEMERVTVEYGQTPSTSIIPSIPGDEQYTYEFAGWTPEIQPVTGEATYTATFTATPRTYAITFKNYNGVLLQTIQVAYGKVPVYSGETPSKPTTAKYTYVFSGWDKEITAVTGDATYTAVFESIINTYTVIFYDEDGTELDRVEVEYGKMPTYTGETPTKADDEEYTYTFVGWTPKLKTVTGDAAYTATYTAAPKGQGLDQINDQSSATKVMINGTIYILRAGKTYTVDGVLVE